MNSDFSTGHCQQPHLVGYVPAVIDLIERDVGCGCVLWEHVPHGTEKISRTENALKASETSHSKWIQRCSWTWNRDIYRHLQKSLQVRHVPLVIGLLSKREMSLKEIDSTFEDTLQSKWTETLRNTNTSSNSNCIRGHAQQVNFKKGKCWKCFCWLMESSFIRFRDNSEQF